MVVVMETENGEQRADQLLASVLVKSRFWSDYFMSFNSLFLIGTV